VIDAETFQLVFDVAAVVRVERGDGLPVILEVAADAVAALQLEVQLLRRFQQRRIVPDRPRLNSMVVGFGMRRR
jgi:hypothetical protein